MGLTVLLVTKEKKALEILMTELGSSCFVQECWLSLIRLFLAGFESV